MSSCTSTNTHCVNCGLDDHTSWSRECLTFVRKCQEFNTKHLENGLPYYPSTEPWTWASAPQRLEENCFFRPDQPPPHKD